MILRGILQTYESGDDIFLSNLMDPNSRYSKISRVDTEEVGIPKPMRRKSFDIGFVKVYRPVLFQKIRKFIGIPEETYLKCLDFENVGMNCLTDSDSKSGQTFWISKDEKIVLKTIKKYECKNLYNILTEYSQHIEECSGRSCISAVLGLYRVVLKNGGKRYFMVSRNVYPVNERFNENQNNVINNHENDENFRNNIIQNNGIDIENENMNSNPNKILMKKFDLKGSTIGRKASSTSTVMKDLNLISSGNIFPLGETVRKIFLRTLEKDVLFFRKHFFMDYSLLVAVEDTPRVLGSHLNDRFSDCVSVLPSDR